MHKRYFLILTVLALTLAACSNTPPVPAAPTSVPATAAPDPYAGDPSIGPADAPVVVIEYANFECALCRQWQETQVYKGLTDEFGDQVRYVWRDYPIASLNSPLAAEAGQCANAQGKFFEFADVAVKLRGALTEDTLKQLAARLGLDTTQFNNCLSLGQFASKVKQSWDEAKALQPFAPIWLVNGELVENAGPQTLVAAINKALGK